MFAARNVGNLPAGRDRFIIFSICLLAEGQRVVVIWEVDLA